MSVSATIQLMKLLLLNFWAIGLLYKLNRFLPETILKTLYTSPIHPYLSYGIEGCHGTYQNNTFKIFVLQKKAIRAINNLAYNEHANAYFKCSKILKLVNSASSLELCFPSITLKC